MSIVGEFRINPCYFSDMPGIVQVTCKGSLGIFNAIVLNHDVDRIDRVMLGYLPTRHIREL